MSKLTLSVDKDVVSAARRYAKLRGVSISAMVEAYLSAVADTVSPNAQDAPILRSLRGSLKKAKAEDYRRHLTAKYK